MSREVRKIRVVSIDDSPPSFIFPNINVLRLYGLSGVIQWLHGGGVPEADLIFCDVNMKENWEDHPSHVEWGVAGALPAYGPLLALPFVLGRRVCQFVPYSSYWAAVQSNGYVLTAMALLLSAFEGREYDLADVQEWIRSQTLGKANRENADRLGSATGTTDVTINMNAALKGFRRRLREACGQNRVTIAGLRSTIDAINAWREGGQFTEVDGQPIRLEIIYPDRVEFIAIDSLYSDFLHHLKVPLARDLSSVVWELESWTKLGDAFNFPRTGGLYEYAAKLLLHAMPYDGVNASNGLKKRAKLFADASGIDVHCMIRMAIIFAFLRAWYFTHVSELPEHTNMPKSLDNDNEDWGTFDLRDWAYFFLDIDIEKDPINRFKRLLGRNEGTKIVVGQSFHQRPFDADAKEDALAAYAALEKNIVLDILPVEKAIARRFVLDKTRFFPDSMPHEHKVTWEPDRHPGQPAYPVWLL